MLDPMKNREIAFVFNMLIASTIAAVIEMLLSSLICGSVHEKCEHIYVVLDELTENDFNDYEYNEWLLFKNIDTKTTFGFTIGGFAPIRKTTLIKVLININYYFYN